MINWDDGRPVEMPVGAAKAESKSDEDVLNFFRTEWGVTAVVEPSQHGFELLAWILPFVGLIAGTISAGHRGHKVEAASCCRERR